MGRSANASASTSAASVGLLRPSRGLDPEPATGWSVWTSSWASRRWPSAVPGWKRPAAKNTWLPIVNAAAPVAAAAAAAGSSANTRTWLKSHPKRASIASLTGSSSRSPVVGPFGRARAGAPRLRTGTRSPLTTRARGSHRTAHRQDAPAEVDGDVDRSGVVQDDDGQRGEVVADAVGGNGRRHRGAPSLGHEWPLDVARSGPGRYEPVVAGAVLVRLILDPAGELHLDTVFQRQPLPFDNLERPVGRQHRLALGRRPTPMVPAAQEGVEREIAVQR